MSDPKFVIEHLDPRTLKPHPLNFRRHPEETQMAALRASLEEHGWLAAPIVNRQTRRILDGHARVEYALGREETIPVRVVDVPEEQERRILASFDRVGEMSERDDHALANLLQSLADTEEGLPPGWGDDDLSALLAGSIKEAPDEFPEVDENIETQYCCPKCSFSWSGKPS